MNDDNFDYKSQQEENRKKGIKGGSSQGQAEVPQTPLSKPQKENQEERREGM